MQRVSNMGILLVVFLIPIILITLYIVSEKNIFPFEIEGLSKKTVHIGRVPIAVTIADTREKRTRGLSGVESLPINEGLLFVFPTSGAHGIWMKDMRIPIDIIWISENSRVVDIEKNVTPETFPTIFYPKEVALYVLEVNALFTEVRGIQIGDEVSLPK